MGKFNGGTQRTVFQRKISIFNRGLRVQNLSNPAGAGIGRRKHHNYKRKHHNSSKNHADILTVCYQRANFHCSGFYIVGADSKNSGSCHTENNTNGRHQKTGNVSGGYGRKRVVFIGLFKASAFCILPVKGADDTDSFQRLQKQTVHVIQLFPQADRTAGCKGNEKGQHSQ